jgi:hypothetical protein
MPVGRAAPLRGWSGEFEALGETICVYDGTVDMRASKSRVREGVKVQILLDTPNMKRSGEMVDTRPKRGVPTGVQVQVLSRFKRRSGVTVATLVLETSA